MPELHQAQTALPISMINLPRSRKSENL